MDYEQVAEEYVKKMSLSGPGESLSLKFSELLRGENAILNILGEKGDMTPSKLSNYLGNSTARIANTLKSLEGKGFILRNRDDEDKRRILVSITDKGMAHVQKKKEECKAFVAKLIRLMGPKEVAEYLRLEAKAARLLYAKRKGTVE